MVGPNQSTTSSSDIATRGGSRAGDLRFADGDRLYERLRGGRFVLVAPPGVEDAVAPWSSAVRVGVPADVQQPAMLVRPDGYVAWAGNPATHGLRDTLARWFIPDSAPAGETATHAAHDAAG